MCGTNFIGPELPLSQADKDVIVSNHNRIRNEVNPPAAAMHVMVTYLLTDIISVSYVIFLNVFVYVGECVFVYMNE